MSGDIGLNMYEQSFHYLSEPLASNYHSEYNHNELPSHQHLRTIVHNLPQKRQQHPSVQEGTSANPTRIDSLFIQFFLFPCVGLCELPPTGAPYTFLL